MPVQPLPKEMEGEGDSAAEMNGEEESEDERSASPSESEEESSEMNDEDYERRRAECVDEMLDLEKQFSEIKEKLFKERLNQVKAKLEDVMSGKAVEYLDPLAVLQNHMQIRMEVAGIYRGLCLEVIEHRYQCELQGAQQHLESEKLLLFDSLEERLLERIQRLEDDRHSVGLTSGGFPSTVGYPSPCLHANVVPWSRKNQDSVSEHPVYLGIVPFAKNPDVEKAPSLCPKTQQRLPTRKDQGFLTVLDYSSHISRLTCPGKDGSFNPIGLKDAKEVGRDG
ncbi:breast cancer metastasis-suppressor 1, partial [Python bivittatus]|uniref:Breast cancer metastasis-suppressor 1 n=1 Tax=Python bivittatus TaxID=176946 RepID=A0A9F5JC65_PYTBI